MAKKKMDLEAFNSYIHSEAFITDFGIRHTAKDSFSWLIYTPKQGKHIVWMNGYGQGTWQRIALYCRSFFYILLLLGLEGY